jgi:mRNA-degrading endonuclease RelE of RelBE toxin-antitoxin system
MNFSILTIPPFERNFKRLLKKYPSLKADLSNLLEELIINPETGKPLSKNYRPKNSSANDL